MIENLEKVVIVTGSSRGLGRALSEYLLNKGYLVYGVSKSQSELVHPGYTHFSLDVTEHDEVQEFFKVLRKSNVIPYGLINNAGVLTSQYAAILHPEAAKRMVLTNLYAPFVMSREAARAMKKASRGRIIHIGSMAPTLNVPGDSVYAATKIGLETFSQILAMELGSSGITSNTLGISAFESDMLSQLPQDSLNEALQRLPLPRLAELEDVANVIDFFLSERSSYITAQTIYLGGAH
jgi:3-oxoacyl-[acyl-carrier protein] reductase